MARSHRCCRTSCSTIWTRNWSVEATPSAATPTTATSMFGSRRAGERVMASITQFLAERLRLTVNVAKSAVDRPWNRSFLGYSVTELTSNRACGWRPGAWSGCATSCRATLRQGRGRSLRTPSKTLAPILRGWLNYFRLAQAKGVFEELDGWLRRKLRCILWRQWKTTTHPRQALDATRARPRPGMAGRPTTDAVPGGMPGPAT